MSDQVITKGDVINLLYKKFHLEINQIIDIRQIFADEMDTADLVFNLAYIFPLGCNIKNAVKDLLNMINLKCKDEDIERSIPIFENFLNQYNTI